MRLGQAQRATYTVQEVADLLGMSRNNAYRAINDGEVPAKRVGRRWVVPRKTFDTWLEDCTLPEVA
ncbi:helix-turn-helix domain-containing protein [Nocardia brasiliensis]|uniref:Helix-turn-helix domain-containing protein n=1 Tax=Nocardia brasiliensis TaxID=37326 RepID=A0A6G9XJ59_NOCBR|nr:helix-turn-helix domain-containing protein [Nocardia brasiliensis]QIS00941.1 helix-turn-helix domain-containing protein [Nocardia brasiliensis]